MALELFTNGKFIAGDTFDQSVSLADYPAAEGWQLKLRIVPRTGGTAIVIAGSADGDDHVLQASAALTAAWTAGGASWAAWVEKDDESFSIEAGQLTIVADPRTLAAGVDTRSVAARALEAIDLTLLGKGTTATASYTIKDRTLSSYSLDELRRLRDYFAEEVRREERTAAGVGSGRTIRVRFGAAR